MQGQRCDATERGRWMYLRNYQTGEGTGEDTEGNGETENVVKVNGRGKWMKIDEKTIGMTAIIICWLRRSQIWQSEVFVRSKGGAMVEQGQGSARGQSQNHKHSTDCAWQPWLLEWEKGTNHRSPTTDTARPDTAQQERGRQSVDSRPQTADSRR